MNLVVGQRLKTVNGLDVEITKVRDDPNYSHPYEGFIFNRYRGVEKSKATWRRDGKMSMFDTDFCLVEVENEQ